MQNENQKDFQIQENQGFSVQKNHRKASKVFLVLVLRGKTSENEQESRYRRNIKNSYVSYLIWSFACCSLFFN